MSRNAPARARAAAPAERGNGSAGRSCPVQLLVEPELGPDGVIHGPDAARQQLAWTGVATALAAEIGEPQGVRTVVFDLLVEEGGGRVALRLDAEPGEEAIATARLVSRALGERARPSVKSLAGDGIPTRWFPDLESFEEATAEERLG